MKLIINWKNHAKREDVRTKLADDSHTDSMSVFIPLRFLSQTTFQLISLQRNVISLVSHDGKYISHLIEEICLIFSR